jgi:hypothetical protein
MIDYPNFMIVSRGDRHRLEADRNARPQREPFGRNIEDFQSVIGRIDRKQFSPVR